MPYGVPKEFGGDTPENDAKMEKCIAGVMEDGVEKEAAIKICKDRLFSHKEKDDKEPKK